MGSALRGLGNPLTYSTLSYNLFLTKLTALIKDIAILESIFGFSAHKNVSTQYLISGAITQNLTNGRPLNHSKCSEDIDILIYCLY